MDEGNFWVASQWFKWLSSGSVDSRVANWQISGMIGHEFGSIGRGVVWVALQWHTGTELTEPALRRIWVTQHWIAPDWTESENLAKIEASDWWRARNAGFWLVQRTLWKCSKGVPLRSWACATGAVLKLYTMKTCSPEIMLSLIDTRVVAVGQQWLKWYCIGRLVVHW